MDAKANDWYDAAEKQSHGLVSSTDLWAALDQRFFPPEEDFDDHVLSSDEARLFRETLRKTQQSDFVSRDAFLSALRQSTEFWMNTTTFPTPAPSPGILLDDDDDLLDDDDDDDPVHHTMDQENEPGQPRSPEGQPRSPEYRVPPKEAVPPPLCDVQPAPSAASLPPSFDEPAIPPLEEAQPPPVPQEEEQAPQPPPVQAPAPEPPPVPVQTTTTTTPPHMAQEVVDLAAQALARADELIRRNRAPPPEETDDLVAVLARELAMRALARPRTVPVRLLGSDFRRPKAEAKPPPKPTTPVTWWEAAAFEAKGLCHDDQNNNKKDQNKNNSKNRYQESEEEEEDPWTATMENLENLVPAGSPGLGADVRFQTNFLDITTKLADAARQTDPSKTTADDIMMRSAIAETLRQRLTSPASIAAIRREALAKVARSSSPVVVVPPKAKSPPKPRERRAVAKPPGRWLP